MGLDCDWKQHDCLFYIYLAIFLLNNFKEKEKVFVEKIEFLNSVKDWIFATIYCSKMFENIPGLGGD